jgi:hypothetical protein
VVAGLLVFGALFAVNSSLHSYLILAFTRAERVTMDVGFYYMANAAGRLRHGSVGWADLPLARPHAAVRRGAGHLRAMPREHALN